MREHRLSPGVVALGVMLVLAVVSYAHEILSQFTFYGSLHRRYPFYIAESLDKLLGALLCCLAIYAMHRSGLRGILRELGVAAPILPAMAFALLASLPMLIGFAITRKVTHELSGPPLLFLTVFSPFVEELEFRGFGFWQLRRRARWPFWLACLPPAILFGLGHIEKGQGWSEVAGIFLWAAVGSAVLSWVLEQWQNLWAAFGLHSLMNLYWEIFSISNTALGGWFPFALQTATVVLAILFTWYAKRHGLVREPQITNGRFS